MNAVELFAGVGGFRLGLERAGHKVIWANERDRFACDTYDKNFKDSIDRRDITTVPADDIPAHDLLVGGFPCQAFSIAGKRRGFEDTRGTLFFDIARILEYHVPPYLLLENVKGLLSHDRGSTFETILRTLDGLGYDCQWQVLNSKDFGVPQNRERVFIVGHFRGRPRPEVFPLGGGGSAAEGVLHPTLDANYYKGPSNQRRMIAEPRSKHGKTIKWQDVSPTAQAHWGTGGNNVPVVSGSRIRRLTPIEAERLQGFPDGWTAGVSDTQRYKQMGNAVTVNVIEAIARRLPVDL